ncbi:MAG: NAAT family transporter [FCB group bacterium]|nr:NAAT family transporter [FCB group bacterium]
MDGLFISANLDYFLLCLTTLFTLVNPLGITPIFIVLTERFPRAERVKIARRGVLTAGITLLIFALLGSLIFKVYGITVEAFQIMGGIIFFRSGLRMLEAKVGRTRTTPMEQEESLDQDDIAVSPIGIPIITGPGAITAVMLLSSRATSVTNYGLLVVAITLTLLAVYLIFRGGDRLAKRLGATGMRVFQRIMGLILMVIAVQFVIRGVETVLRRII